MWGSQSGQRQPLKRVRTPGSLEGTQPDGLGRWRARRSKIEAPADSVSGEGLLPHSQVAVPSRCPHVAEGARGLVMRTQIPFTREGRTSQRPHLQISSSGDLDFCVYILEGHEHSASSTGYSQYLQHSL